MKFFNRIIKGLSRSLSRRFSAITILVVFLLFVLFSVIASIYSNIEIEEKLENKVKEVTERVEVIFGSALWNVEKETLQDIVDALFKEKGLVYMRILDGFGGKHEKKAPKYSSVQSFTYFETSSDFVTKSSEIYHKGRKVGDIEFAISKTPYYSDLRTNILSVVLLTVIVLTAISWTIFIITKRYIFIPLRKLEKSASEIAEKKLDCEIDTSGEDEIGNLAKAFDKSRQSIKTLLKELDESNKTLDQNVKDRTAELENRTKELEDSTLELFESEQKLKAVLDNIRRRVYWKDLNGILEGGNRILAQDLGLNDPTELVGIDESKIWKREDSTNMIRDITNKVILKKQGEQNLDRTIINNSGNTRWFKINCSPLLDKADNLTSILVTFRDTTDEKKAEEELKKAKNEAETANKAKDQFLAQVSHEIRTPLHNIVGFTDLVLDSRISNKQNEYLTHVAVSAQELKRIIYDILDYSKMESGELKIYHDAFYLDEALEGVISNFKEQAERKGLLLEYSLEENVPMGLKGDEVRLKQILNNLISNAIKFTEKGSVTLKAAFLQRDKQKVRILFSVIDTGRGISQKDLEKIFQPYHQLISSDEESTKGVGLGLAIAKQLVNLMKGDIQIDSKPGKGTTFKITVSFDRSSSLKKKPKILTTDVVKDFHSEDLSGLKILAVEDNESSQVLIREILTKVGITVDIVGNGKDVLPKIEEKSYDTVLMDLKIPGMSGYDAAKLIRKKRKFKKLPLIALTAHAMVGEREKCKDAGITDYLSKPIDSKKLLNRIMKWIPDIEKKRVLKDSISAQSRSNKSLQVPPEFIDTLRGINVESTLRRLDNVDYTVYMKSLRIFLQNNLQTINSLRSAFEQRDFEKSRYILHTLRGAAVNLGADEIEPIAFNLHNDIKEGLIPGEHAIAELEKALNNVLKSIRSADEVFNTNNIMEKANPIDETQLENLLLKLSKLIEIGDYTAMSVMDDALPHLMQLADRDDLRGLRNLIENFNSKEALKKLKNITTAIGIAL